MSLCKERSDLLLEAARQATFANNYDIAVRLSRAAWEVEPSFEAGHVLADALYSSGAVAEVEAVLSEVEHLAVSEPDRTRVALLRSFNLFWHLGQFDQAVAVVLQPRPQRDADVAEQAQPQVAGVGHPQAVAARAEVLRVRRDHPDPPGETGMRVALAPMLHDTPDHDLLGIALPDALRRRVEGPPRPGPAEMEALFRRLHRDWHGRDGRLLLLLGPNAPQRCSPSRNSRPS